MAKMWLVLWMVLVPCASWYVRVPVTRTSLLHVATEQITSNKDTLAYDVDSWRKGYQNCEKEVCEVLPGAVPADLVGTLYRNGYGKFKVGKDAVMHPFDADGLLSAVTFSNGTAWFRNRFVRTRGYVRERRAKKILFRGAFGTQKPGGMLANFLDVRLKNTANTNVIYWANRLMALWEGGNPYRLEPDSLRTIGEYKLKGLLKSGQPFSAHPKIDANTNRLITFSAQATPQKTTMTVFEFDSELNTQQERKFEVEGFGFFHDFVVTKNYYIFTKCPLKFQPFPFLLGKKGPAECISFQEGEPAELYIVPRNGDAVMKVPVDSHFNFHYSNAYENEQGLIILDVIRCGKMNLGPTSSLKEPIWMTVDYAKEVPYSKLVRYTLEKTLDTWKYSAKEINSHYVDFPVVNPCVVGKPNKYVFACCGADANKPSPVQGIMKFDLETGKSTKWIGAVDEFVSEPAFAPKLNDKNAPEDGGYLVAISSKSKDLTSDVVIFDAQDITKGPITRLPIPTYIPYGLHGNFVSNLTFDYEETKRKFIAYSALDNKNWNEIEGGFSGLGLKYEFE